MGLNWTVNNKKSGTPTPPISTSIPPPFRVYPPFLAKTFCTPQVAQFLEGRTPVPFNNGGSNYDHPDSTFLIIYLTYVYRSERKKNIWCDTAVIIQGFSEKQQSNVPWVKSGKWDCNLANMLLELLWHFG